MRNSRRGRRAPFALPLAFLIALAGPGTALAQSVTEDPALLSAAKPGGNVGFERLRNVLGDVGDFLNAYGAFLPPEQTLETLTRSGAANDWPVSQTLTLFGRRVQLSGVLSIAAEPPADGGALLRYDTKLASAVDFGGGLGLSGADLTFVVGSRTSEGALPVGVGGELKFSFNDATLALGTPLATLASDINEGRSGASYSLTGNATLGEMFPFLAASPKLSGVAVQEITTSGRGITARLTIDGKQATLGAAPSPANAYTLDAMDGIVVGDLVPGADLIPLLADFTVTTVTVTAASVDLAASYGGTRIALEAGPGRFDLHAPLPLSTVLPSLKNIPFADSNRLSSVAIDGDKAVFAATVAGKSVSVTRTRGADATLAVTGAGLGMGDLIAGADKVGLDHYAALDAISVAADHIAVTMEIEQDTAEIYLLRNARPHIGPTAFLYLEKLTPDAFIPYSAKSGLAGVGLTKALIGVGGMAQSFTQATLPGDLGDKVTLTAPFAISPGAVAVSGTFDLSGSKPLVSALQAVSIAGTSFPVSGTLSAYAIQQIPNPKQASNLDSGTMLRNLALSVPMSVPKVPGLETYVRLDGPMTLSIKGNDDTRDPRTLLSGQFPVKMTIEGSDIDLVAAVDFDKALSGQDDTSTISIALAKAWNEPFGVPGIVVDSGGFAVSLANQAVSEMTFDGKASFAGRRNVAVTARFARSGGGLDFDYFEFDASESFKLSGLPGFSSVPDAGSFTVDTIRLSKDGIEAKSLVDKVHVDAFIFKDASGGAVFAIDQKGLRLVDMFPGLAHTPLSDFTLANAAFVVSENGMSGPAAKAAGPAQDLFKDIFGTSTVPLALPSGVALLSKIDFSKSGTVGTALRKIGVQAEEAVVMGAVSGLFGSGSPSLDLSIMMNELGTASGLPKNVMNYKPGTQPGFFVKWAGDEVDIGVRTAIMVKAGSDELEFTSSVEVVFSDTGIGVEVIGGMAGTWHKPFGIEPLSLSDVKLETSVDADGNVTLGFAGAQTMGRENLAVATKMAFAIEAEGLPDAVAFSGSSKEVGPEMLIEIAQAATGGKLDLDKIKLPAFNIKDFDIAFATPGATDAQLGLVSEGIAFAGTFNFMGQDLGKVKGSGGPSGIKFDGALNDLTWGPLSLRKNSIDVAVTAEPKILMHTSLKVLDVYQEMSLDLTPPSLTFTVSEKLDILGEADLTIDAKAVNLSSGGFDPSADFDVTGHFKSSLVPALKTIIEKGVKTLRAAADQKLDEDKKVLADAQAKVKGLDQKIRDQQAKDDKRKADAQARIQAAQDRVNALNSELSHDRNEANSCGNAITHVFCKPYWEIRYAATYAAIAVATGVLEAAKVASNIANDLDPALTALKLERDTARLGLSIAMAVVQGSEDVVNALTGDIDSLIQRTLADLPLTVEEVFFAGGLQAAVRNDVPFLLDIKYTLFGEERRDYLAFKLKDWDFNTDSFAVLPSVVFNKIVDEASSKISPTVVDWLKNHIGTEYAVMTEAVRPDVMKAQAMFQNTLKGMEDHAKSYQASVDSLLKKRAATAASLGTTDFLGPSQQFQLTYIAVGHSALCLSVAQDGTTVHQANCKDGKTQQWRTMQVDDYVLLSTSGLCLQARDESAAKDDQNVLLTLGTCNPGNRAQNWKISSYDNIYSQIVNRASQNCLHFDSENAKPETAKAVWTSCLGMDSQMFRAIADAERPTYFAKNARLQSSEGKCFWYRSIAGTPGVFAQGACDGFNRTPANRNLQEALFDYVELVDGSIRIVHNLNQETTQQNYEKDGFCLQGSLRGDFSDIPCNRSQALLFDVLEVQEHFMLRQKGTNNCVDVSDAGRSLGPFLLPCDAGRQKPSQLLNWTSAAATQ